MEVRLQAQLRTIDQITAAIASHRDLCSIYRMALQHLEDAIPTDFACICRTETPPVAGSVVCIGERSRSLAQSLGWHEGAALGADALAYLAHADQDPCVHEADLRGSPASPWLQRLGALGLGSLAIAPLRDEHGLHGLLLIARRPAHGHDPGARDLLRRLGAQLALAARQAQLHGDLQRACDDLRRSQHTVVQQERLRVVGQMASGIAHDINNAIAPVALYAQTLLERETELTPRGRQHLLTISHAIDDVAATVARLREFYRQRAEPQAVAPFVLNALVRQVAELTRARWSDIPLQRGIVIRMRTALLGDLPSVLGVESEVREALTNLVLNAVDAMPEGGELVLRTRSGGAPASVWIDVADSGVGMDKATRSRCLEPFFTTKGERGTGLGLAMVFGVMQRHHGSVEIESEPGRGSTVSLHFPAARRVVPETAPPPPPPPVLAAPQRLSVLLVDDDPLLLESLTDTLALDGHEVVAAAGGREGIDTFREHLLGLDGRPFDLVVTDLGMPYVDGRRVAACIKTLSHVTPVIMLTGWGQRMLAVDQRPPRVDLMLGKPIRPHALRAAIEQVLAARTHTAFVDTLT